MNCNNKKEHIYIGSRYVPKVEGMWDIRKDYENLSIVVDENFESWTSKKNVPAGIELSNEEYWIKSGGTYGKWVELSDKVKNNEEDITTLFENIDNILNMLSEQNNIITNIIDNNKQITSDVNLLTTGINELKHEVMQLSEQVGKNILDIAEINRHLEGGE